MTPFPISSFRLGRAVELASRLAVFTADTKSNGLVNKEESYAREALKQAKTFLVRSEVAYKKDPKDQSVIQFARTSAQSAENARALAMGAVGGLAVRQLESDLAAVRDELAKVAHTSGNRTAEVPHAASSLQGASPFLKQPALWFAVSGWALAVVLLFRRRSI